MVRTTSPRSIQRFYICTRDRPQAVRRCIESLGQAFREGLPEREAECYVLDDSTTPALSAEVLSAVGSSSAGGLTTHVIGRKFQQAMYRSLAVLPPEYLNLLRCTCRPLGEGAWDLAGVRNFAYLLAHCQAAEDDIVVFLDDDILVTPCTYEGHRFEVDGASLLRELLSNTPAGQLAASGAGYFGRFDGSVLDHLQLRLCETQQALESGLAASEHLRQLSRFPSVLPIQLALPDVRLPLDGPGISGALLATTPASLRSHFLPGCYNEDWIWLALLGRTGTAVRRAGVQAVHAALPQERITTDLVAYQCAGEIVYRAIREISDTWDGGCSLPEHCEASMNVAHFRRAKSSMASEISLAIQRLHELKRSPFREEDLVLAVAARAALCEMLSLFTSSMRWVESADPEALHRRSESYLRQIPLWKGLMLDARDVVG